MSARPFRSPMRGSPSTHHPWLRLWISLGLALLFAAPDAGEGAGGAPPLSVEVSPTARYQLMVDQANQEILVLVKDNQKELAPTINRWSSPLLAEANVLQRTGNQTMIRLKLKRRITVYGALATDPPRLLLSLGSPLPSGSGLVAQTAVDFLMPRPPTAQAAAPPRDIGPPRPPTLQERVAKILVISDQDPPMALPPSYSLPLGANTLYAVPRPPLPTELPVWRPSFDPPAGAREAGGELLAAWRRAKQGDLAGTLAEVDTYLLERSDAEDTLEWRHLQALLSYYLHPEGTPDEPLSTLDRARASAEMSPQHPLGRQSTYLAAMGYQRLGFHHEARRLFMRLAQELPSDHPHLMEVYVGLGWSSLERGNAKEAVDAFVSALRLADPAEQTPIMLALVSALLESGRGRSSLALMELIKARGPRWWGEPYVRLAEAEALYRSNRFKEALERYESLSRVFDRQVQSPYIQVRMAECHLMQAEVGEAAELVARPLDLRGIDANQAEQVQALWDLRTVQLRIMSTPGDRQAPLMRTLQDVRLAVPLSPIEPEALFELGKFSYRTQDFQEAVPYFRELFRKYPEFPLRRTVVELLFTDFSERVKSSFAEGDDFRVLSLYEQFAPVLDAERPGDGRTYRIIAHSYVEMGLYEKAFRALAPSFFSDEPEANERAASLLLLGRIHRLRGKPEEALQTLAFLENRTADASLLHLGALEQARAHVAAGQPAAALAAYQRLAVSAATLPEGPEVLAEMGRVLLGLGRSVEAQAALEQAVALTRPLVVPAPEPPAETRREVPPPKIPHHALSFDEATALQRARTQKDADGPLSDALRHREARIEERLRDAAASTRHRQLHADSLYLLGELQLRNDDLEDAFKTLEEALKTDPTHPSASYARYNQGAALSRLGRHVEARATWSELADREAALPADPWPRLARQMLAQSEWEARLAEIP